MQDPFGNSSASWWRSGRADPIQTLTLRSGHRTVPPTVRISDQNVLSVLDAGDGFDLDQHLGFGRTAACDGQCGPRGFERKDLREHLVHDLEVADVGQVDVRA